jgi:hypothetical protein
MRPSNLTYFVRKLVLTMGSTSFRVAMYARMMLHHNLTDTGSLPGGINGNEAVHLAIQSHAFDDVFTIGFQSTTIIVQTHSRDT